MNQLRFLLARAAPYRGQLLQISVLTMLASLATLAIPWLAGQVISDAATGLGGRLGLVVGLLLLALLVMAILNIVARLASAKSAGQILADLRRDAYSHVQSLPMGFHDRSSQGDILALISWEVGNLSRFLTTTLASAPSMLMMAAGSVILMFLINPVLALVVPILVPALYVLTKLFGRRLRLVSRQVRKAEAQLFANAESQLEMLPAIKSFAVEEERAANYNRLALAARDLAYRQARISAVLPQLTGLVAALAAIGVILLAGGQVGGGEMTPAELFSFLLYAALLTRPVAAMGEFYSQLQIARGTLGRLQAVLSMPPERGIAATGQLPPPVRGEVQFADVAFRYAGRDELLSAVNFTVQPGETIALTGENGAGKSTLIKLLLGFYAPESGAILVDGQDISGLQLQAYRRLIGLVPQRALLFSGTVRENIAFGHGDASDSQIETACRIAQAHEFIERLPKGLETGIGDHGVRLSGGQRQRIALARALLGNPPILIFDEATSMFDLEGEAAFIEECASALEGRTVFIVTHRPASLALADRILKVEQGRVVETSAR